MTVWKLLEKTFPCPIERVKFMQWFLLHFDEKFKEYKWSKPI